MTPVNKYLWTYDNFVLTDGTEVNSNKVVSGVYGDTGQTGNGIQQIAKTSTSGLTDTYTITYTNGGTETFTVTNGAKGDKGNTGDTGPRGIGIYSVVNYYLATAQSSGVTEDTVGWSTVPQTITPTKKYLWWYEVITFTDYTNFHSFPTIMGVYGDKGETGSTGNGISGISKTSTSGLVDTYTITYTNGNTTTFNVTNGEKGETGDTGATPDIQIGTVESGDTSSVTVTGTPEEPVLNFVLEKGDTGETGATGATGNGISSITKTGTSGYVDTYTIAYTNGTSTTFDVTNGEVSQAQLDETNERVERAEMVYNALPKVNGSGEEITLDNTAETPLKMELSGNTSQFSTTGKNLIPNPKNTQTINGITFTKNSDGSMTLSGTATANAILSILVEGAESNPTLPAGTYTLSGCPTGGSATSYKLDISVDGYKQDLGSGVTFTLNEATKINYVRIFIYNGQTMNNAIFKPMVESGSSATSYEPYTGNSPAPNPDYPQDIEVVSGDNTIKVEGKNLAHDITYTSQTNRYYSLVKASYKVVKDKYYAISVNTPNTGLTCYINLGTATLLTLVSSNYNETLNGTRKTWIVKADANGEVSNVSLIARGSATSTTETGLLSNLQIENIASSSSTATDYEPYQNQSQEYSVNLGSLELCKINDYKDKIKRSSGKNLFNSTIQAGTYTGTNHTATYTVANDGKITQSETDDSAFNTSQGRSFTLPAGTYSYTIIGKSNSTNIQIRNVTDGEDLIKTTTSTGTFTISAEKVVGIKTYSSTDTYPQSYYVQIEKGTSATTYEPYGKVWCKYKEIGKVVLNGSEDNWQDRPSYESADRFVRDNTFLGQKTNEKNGYSNNFIVQIVSTTTYPYVYLNNGQCVINFSVKGTTTLEQFKTWLSTHNTEVYYVLANPTNEPITDTTLINQLDLLEKAYAYQNQTNISQQNNDKPFEIDAETVYDLSNLVTRVEALES